MNTREIHSKRTQKLNWPKDDRGAFYLKKSFLCIKKSYSCLEKAEGDCEPLRLEDGLTADRSLFRYHRA